MSDTPKTPAEVLHDAALNVAHFVSDNETELLTALHFSGEPDDLELARDLGAAMTAWRNASNAFLASLAGISPKQEANGG